MMKRVEKVCIYRLEDIGYYLVAFHFKGGKWCEVISYTRFYTNALILAREFAEKEDCPIFHVELSMRDFYQIPAVADYE